MKIDKKDWERVMDKIDKNLVVNKRYILDMPKYTYWAEKSSEYIDLMNENREDKEKWYKYLRESLLCEFEKNRFCRITRKEFIILFTMLKLYNSNNPKNKIYMNEKGCRVRYRVRNQ